MDVVPMLDTGPIAMPSAVAVRFDDHAGRVVGPQPTDKKNCSVAGRPNRLPTGYGSTILTPLRCESAITRSLRGWRLIPAWEEPGLAPSATIVGVENAMAVGHVPRTFPDGYPLPTNRPSSSAEGV